MRGLAVNPANAFLVVSGSDDADVQIWDLNELKSCMPGSSKSTSDLAWKQQQAFILAAASANGFTTLWDLGHRREIAQLAEKSSVSVIAWSPSPPRTTIRGHLPVGLEECERARQAAERRA